MKQLLVLYFTLFSPLAHASFCGYCHGDKAKCNAQVLGKHSTPPYAIANVKGPWGSHQCALQDNAYPYSGAQFFWKSYKWIYDGYCSASHEWGFSPWRSMSWYSGISDQSDRYQGQDHCWRMCQNRGFQNMVWTWTGSKCTCEMAGKYDDFLGYKCGEFYDKDNKETNKGVEKYKSIVIAYSSFRGGRGFQLFEDEDVEDYDPEDYPDTNELARAVQEGFEIYGGYGKKIVKTETKTAYQAICPRGSYHWNHNLCRFCEMGKYSPESHNEWSQTGCKPCGTGKVQLKYGQTSCSSCRPGQYQDQTGQKGSEELDSEGKVHPVCKACPAGKFSSTEASACTSCSKGYYQDQTRQSTCKICPKGFYQNKTESTECNRCGVAKYQFETGATKESDCKKCHTGRYTETDANTKFSSCKQCEYGKYQDQEGQAMCKTCDADIDHYQCDFSRDEHCLPGQVWNSDTEMCDVCDYGSGVLGRNSVCVKCDTDNKNFPQMRTTFSLENIQTSKEILQTHFQSLCTKPGEKTVVIELETTKFNYYPDISYADGITGAAVDAPYNFLRPQHIFRYSVTHCHDTCLNYIDDADREPIAIVFHKRSNKCYCVLSTVAIPYNVDDGFNPTKNPDRQDLEGRTDTGQEKAYIDSSKYYNMNDCIEAITDEAYMGHALNTVVADRNGWCSQEEGSGNLIMIFQSDRKTKYGTIIRSNRDRDGKKATTPYERKRNCAYACLNKWEPDSESNGQWIDLVKSLETNSTLIESMRHPTGFSVNPQNGQCFCLVSDFDKCTYQNEDLFKSWRIFNSCGDMCNA